MDSVVTKQQLLTKNIYRYLEYFLTSNQGNKMTMLQISQGEGSEYIDHQYAFTARMDNVKILSQLLKCISFR